MVTIRAARALALVPMTAGLAAGAAPPAASPAPPAFEVLWRFEAGG
jgi:hypothetical protein